ncbi:MAG: PEP-CTERM sorting domain-containing protein [Cyanobacteria bacterium P01_D01_bin.56]
MPNLLTQPFLASSAIISLAVVALGSQAAEAAFFRGLGYLPGLDTSSQASDISADGTTVIGISRKEGPGGRSSASFRWTARTGLTKIPATNFLADAISDNGQVIVGSRSGSGEILRWSASQGTTVLGPLGFADGVSGDGSIVVGYTGRAAATQAFQWTATIGLMGLEMPSGIDRLQGATDVSDSGAVIVGYSDNIQTGALVPVRWAGQTGFTQLGNHDFGAASSVSSNGNIVVGFAGSANSDPDGEAFLWSSQQNIGLGDLQNGAGISIATDVSDDGTVVVGSSTSNQGAPSLSFSLIFGDRPQEAFIWTRSRGMRSVRDVLINDFRLSLAGWTLLSAEAVSQDGITLVGTGINPNGKQEAWIARLD